MRTRKEYFQAAIMLLAIFLALNVIQGNRFFSFDMFITKLYLLPGIIIGLTLHEFSHALVSYKLGDPTPHMQGRVSINPLKHIDPIGFVALIIAGFGWGIPVQINPNYYKHRRRDEALVAVAGVTMNFIIAVIFILAMKLIISIMGFNIAGNQAISILIKVLSLGAYINIVLMIFNLMPIPPLDGFNIVTHIFKLDKYSWWGKLYQSGTFILVALILFDIINKVLNPIVSIIYNGLMSFII